MKNLVSLIAATLMLVGCATTQEYGRQVVEYGKQAGSWIGQKIESLYSIEGKPSSVQPQADGGSVIEYRTQQTVPTRTGDAGATSATTSAAANQTEKNSLPPNTRVVPCTSRYRTDNSGTIRSWTIDGEGCKAIEVATPQQMPQQP